MADGVQKLAALQDIDLMIRESSKEKDLGFSTEGRESLEQAREKLAGQIENR